MPSVDDLFQRHLGGLAGEALLPGYDHYAMTFAVYLRDIEQWWWIDVQKGAIVAVQGPLRTLDPPAVWFALDAAVLLRIARGELSPQAAFFTEERVWLRRRQCEVPSNGRGPARSQASADCLSVAEYAGNVA